MTQANLPVLADFARIVARHTVYRARLGRNREYSSAAEANAYDDGVIAFKEHGDIPAIGTPGWAGYFDSEKSYLNRDDSRDGGDE